MAKRLLGMLMALLMACPTTTFAQDDVFAALRNQPSGVRVVLVLRDEPTVKGSLVSLTDEALVVGTLDRIRGTATLRNAPGVSGAFVFRRSDVVSAEVERDRRTFYVAAPGHAPDPESARQAVARVKTGRTIDVTTVEGTTYRGALAATRAEAFDVTVGRRLVTVSYSDVVAVGPTGMSRGEKALLHTGLALATLFAAWVGLMYSLCSHDC